MNQRQKSPLQNREQIQIRSVNRYTPLTPNKERDVSPNSNKNTNRKIQQIDSDKVKVVLRIRPFLEDEEQIDAFQVIEENTLKIQKGFGKTTTMKFDNILQKNSSQKDVFNLNKGLIKHFVDGENSTIFAYGQTGAGKTFTIGSDCIQDQMNQQGGLIQRAFQMIFKQLSEERLMFELGFSLFEVYNEKIFDLLNHSSLIQGKHLDVLDGPSNKVQIQNLKIVPIHSLDDAFQILENGIQNRMVRTTAHNVNSSRSHCIIQLTLKKGVIISKMRIVDLAGSEKFQISSKLSNAERDLRTQELVSINGSLSALGNCITALMDKQRSHIPYRNSKLTRVLSDSLSNGCKLCFIICLSPGMQTCSESFQTLQFANRAKNLVVKLSNPKNQLQVSNDEKYELLKIAYEEEKDKRLQYEKFLKEKMSSNSNQEVQILKYENSCLKEKIHKLERNEKSIKSQKVGTPLQEINQNDISSQSCLTRVRNFLQYTDRVRDFTEKSPNRFEETFQSRKIDNSPNQIDNKIHEKSPFQNTNLSSYIYKNLGSNKEQLIQKKQMEITQKVMDYTKYDTNDNAHTSDYFSFKQNPSKQLKFQNENIQVDQENHSPNQLIQYKYNQEQQYKQNQENQLNNLNQKQIKNHSNKINNVQNYNQETKQNLNQNMFQNNLQNYSNQSQDSIEEFEIENFQIKMNNNYKMQKQNNHFDSKSGNIQYLMNDLKTEMSKAMAHLQLLQEKDSNIKMI